jgi:sialic acid synthase SpsE
LKFQLPLACRGENYRKHFYGQNFAGPDHVASLEPEELKAMVKGDTK